ncbi:GntR family transcriptional regulator [uncultured Desulfovibrio sp.]|uniref:GntR family transcriptional regulator n=1 Tax=uncultured Desulfovibrio sp. TaxID=167968 RepID=UPI0028062224|nr:GntR family transcriptional regulator [uncultured Desulfovibrio sp.]
MAATSPVKSVQAYNRIRELILRGKLLPGSRLVLADLEEKLDVGRGPIREALMRLDRSGLIRNLPYKGAVVAPLPTYREIRHIYDLRVQLECTLATEAMHNSTEKDCRTLESILGKMDVATFENSFFFQPDREFHYTMYKMANMPHLLNTANSLVDHVEIFLNNRYYCKRDQQLLIGQHREILQAFREKNEQQLRERLKINILIGLQLIQQEMERMGTADWGLKSL